MIEKYTEGRSASFFYFSEDSKYIVKTLTLTEAQLFIRILPSYCEYMCAYPSTFITRICGFHSMKMYGLTLYIIVMSNVLETAVSIDERFDLKGSYVERYSQVLQSAYRDENLHRNTKNMEEKNKIFQKY